MKEGSNTKKGYTYHELPNSGIPAQRLYLKKRVAFILSKVNVDKKMTLDLGCNVGGVAYLMAKAGASIDGVDYDSDSIELGNNYLKGKKWNGTNVVLIDYAWAIHEGENFKAPAWTGGKYRCPGKFDDEYSLRKIKEELDAKSLP